MCFLIQAKERKRQLPLSVIVVQAQSGTFYTREKSDSVIFCLIFHIKCSSVPSGAPLMFVVPWITVKYLYENEE